jgi:hypothetical protein
MNTKTFLKLFALFAMVVLTSSTETGENLRVLEENKEVTQENKEVAQEKRDLSELPVESKQEVPAENKQEVPAEANGEAPKEGEGRFLVCRANYQGCARRQECCSTICYGGMCLPK